MLKPIVNDKRTYKDLSGFWACAPEHPTNPINVTQPLNGRWHLPVPGAFNRSSSPEELQHYDGILVFETQFEVTAEDKTSRLVLRFESVVHHCKVYINGRQAMENRGGYLPFEAAVNDLVQVGDNRLTVRLTNLLDAGTLPPGDYHTDETTASGFCNEGFSNHGDAAGILGQVLMYTTPWFYIDHIALATHSTKTGADLHVAVTVIGPKDSVMVQVLDEVGRAITCGEVGETPLHIENPKFWDLGAPFFYHLKVETKVADTIMDAYTLPFALRQVRITPEGLFLNGHPLQAPLQAWPYETLGEPYVPGAETRLAAWLHLNGCHFLWTGNVPVLPAVLDEADRLGIGLITGVGHGLWATMPEDARQEPAFSHRTNTHTLMMLQTIKRDANHPAVLAWYIGQAHPLMTPHFTTLMDALPQQDSQERPLVLLRDPKLPFSLCEDKNWSLQPTAMPRCWELVPTLDAGA